MSMKKLMMRAKYRGQLMKCFKDAEMFKTRTYGTKTHEYYPKVHETKIDLNEKTKEVEHIRFTFTLANGTDPSIVEKKIWIFKQYFTNNIELHGNDSKKFILHVYFKSMPTEVKYNFKKIEPKMKDNHVPLVIGYDRRSELVVLDLKKVHHVLMTGNTGSGKSSLFRSMITSLILHKSPEEIQFVMADFKKSELGLFRNLPHVKDIYMDEHPFHLELKRIYREMKRRGDLLDKYDLEHVSELPEKLPIIMIVIDELYELTQNKKIMKLLTKISALGRSSQIHLMCAIQSGRASDIDGQMLNNLNCRISGKQGDKTNAQVSGFASTKDIDVAGRMVLSLHGEERQVQVPYINKQDAKKLLTHLKVTTNSVTPSESQLNVVDVVQLVDPIEIDSADGDHVENVNDFKIAELPKLGGIKK